MTLSERNAAIEKHLPLIRSIVRTAVGERLADEYLGVAVLTFIDRFPRFVPGNVTLNTFLYRAIIGDCRRELWKQGAAAVAFPKPGQHKYKATGKTNYDDQLRKRGAVSIQDHHSTTPSHVPALIEAEDARRTTEKAWELVGRLQDRRQSEAVMLRMSGVQHARIDELMGTGKHCSFYYERRAMQNLKAMVAIEATPSPDTPAPSRESGTPAEPASPAAP